MVLYIFLMILGMVVLIKGSDMLIEGASSLARRFNISELTIGLTIVAFGTSAPEFVVSLSAAINSYSEIAFGNIIGSINFNLLVILGITGLIAPIAVQKNTAKIEIPYSLLGAIILLVLVNFSLFISERNELARIEGLILLLFFGIFILYVFKNAKQTKSVDSISNVIVYSLSKSILFVIVGLFFLFLGGRIVVISAVELANIFNISEKIIGLTIIAVGTSLPELVTSITAIIKKKDDIAIGNIIGSNIFNVYFILGVCSLVNPMKYSQSFNLDILIYIIGSLFIFFAMFIGKKYKLDRWKSLILIFIYIGYFIHLFMNT